MERSLIKLAKVVRERVNPDNCCLDGNGDCRAFGFKGPFNLKQEEVEDFATTSCGADLWAFRALAYRLGVKVPHADWVWYNK